jgi:very-long-chain (3R)-3-hydroxyacyl-CoA dehydratase
MPPKTSHPSSTAPRKTTPSAAKNTYLILYNALSAALWAGVLYKTVTVGTHEVLHGGQKGWLQFGKSRYGGLEALGSGKVYDELETYTRWTQTLAGAEVVHSLLGGLHYTPLLSGDVVKT